MHICGTYVHKYTKYEVPMSNPVPGGCAQMPTLMPMTHEGQFMIVKVLWLINQMSQKVNVKNGLLLKN